MKQFITLFIVTVFTTTVVAQKATLKTRAQEWNLKGNVKSITESAYDMVEVDGKFDKGKLVNYTVYELDKEGSMASETVYSMGVVERIWKFKHSKPGQTTEAALYNSNNKLMQKTIFKYNANDFEISSIQYDSLEKTIDQSSTEVKSINELKYVTIRNDDNGGKKYIHTDTVVLMPNGRIKYTTSVTLGEFNRTNYYYDREGRRTRDIYEKQNGNKAQADIEYNEVGDVKRETYGKLPANAPRGALPVINWEKTYLYEYDLQGNWIKKVTLDPYESWFNSLIERTITYY